MEYDSKALSYQSMELKDFVTLIGTYVAGFATKNRFGHT